MQKDHKMSRLSSGVECSLVVNYPRPTVDLRVSSTLWLEPTRSGLPDDKQAVFLTFINLLLLLFLTSFVPNPILLFHAQQCSKLILLFSIIEL